MLIMYKRFEDLHLSYAQNVVNVAIAAEIAILPPNCPADSREAVVRSIRSSIAQDVEFNDKFG